MTGIHKENLTRVQKKEQVSSLTRPQPEVHLHILDYFFTYLENGSCAREEHAWKGVM